MTDIPIIFSGPMVRALLEGRKTMTRRILKPQPEQARDNDGNLLPHGIMHVEGDPRPRVTIGRVITKQEVRWATGDRLWVRENHRLTDCPCTEACRGAGHVWYDADASGYRNVASNKLRPSIHMPRWASRLTLIVTATKIERVQEISNEDALAEGVLDAGKYFYGDGEKPVHFGVGAAHAFRDLWTMLHGCDSWDANPEVVAISFNVIKANIDAPTARAA